MAWDICVLRLFPRPIPLWGAAIVPIVADRYQPCLSRWVRGNVRLLNVRLLTVFITGSCLLSCCVKELPYAQYFLEKKIK